MILELDHWSAEECIFYIIKYDPEYSENNRIQFNKLIIAHSLLGTSISYEEKINMLHSLSLSRNKKIQLNPCIRDYIEYCWMWYLHHKKRVLLSPNDFIARLSDIGIKIPGIIRMAIFAMAYKDFQNEKLIRLKQEEIEKLTTKLAIIENISSVELRGLLFYFIDKRKDGMSDKEIAQDLIDRLKIPRNAIGAILRPSREPIANYGQWLDTEVLGKTKGKNG